jgi:hypothetical protein
MGPTAPSPTTMLMLYLASLGTGGTRLYAVATFEISSFYGKQPKAFHGHLSTVSDRSNYAVFSVLLALLLCWS